MKKKIIFIICTIVILCATSMVSAATTLKDIKNTKYEDSVDTLITLGLVNGYKEADGTYTYKPENVVTRAEMAKLMVVALGQEGNVANASKSSPKFKDVKSSDWEYGYVNLASELGIINGYPDGTFGSKNTVSYAEATAMIIRALEYEDVVSKSTEVWPNNYVNQAKKLSLYTQVGTINSSDGAKRGNVAIMLWNMLRTGVCTPVGQNSNGIIYGEGEKMINKKMTKFIYLEDATIQDIDFDDDYKEANVKFKGTRTITVTLDALEAAKMYGQKFDILYNASTKKIEQIAKSSSNTVKEGEIEKLTSSKIYIDGGNSKGYELPDDDNILLYGIDDMEDAVTAILVFDGSSLEYVVMFPPEQVYLAIVTDNDVTVSKKDGIKVANYKTSTSKSYALADEDDIPDEDDIILYYLNSDNEIVIIDKTNLYDSELVENASKTKITLEDKGKITLGDADTYVVAKVTNSSLKAMSISDIEADDDSADVLEFAGMKYIIVYVGGVESAEEGIENDLKTYKSYLYSYIKKAKGVSEKTYTQASYAALIKALDAAEEVYALKSPTLSKVKTAYNNLKTVYDSLAKAVTTTEKNTVAAKYNLRTLVNGDAETCVKNKNIYTDDSYKKFNTALTVANTLLEKTNAPQSKLEEATTNLREAINALVKKVDDTARTEAINALNNALKAAEKVGSASEYTKDSYDNFKECWDAAKLIKTSTDTIESIKGAAESLERAIRLLEKGKDEILATLNALLLEAQTYEDKADEYMPETYKKFEDALLKARNEKNSSIATYESLKKAAENLKAAMADLEKVADVLNEVKSKASKYKIDTIKDLLDMPESTLEEKIQKIEALEKAMEEEDKEIAAIKKSLNARIEEAKSITEEEWNTIGYAGTYANMQSKLIAAESIVLKTDVTSSELRTALQELTSALELAT